MQGGPQGLRRRKCRTWGIHAPYVRRGNACSDLPVLPAFYTGRPSSDVISMIRPTGGEIDLFPHE